MDQETQCFKHCAGQTGAEERARGSRERDNGAFRRPCCSWPSARS